MRKKIGIIKRVLCIGLIFLLSINSFAAIVSDNDGSAFITKAEFDALKSSFQAQIDSYNQSIDSKIDGAIASYLAGIKLSTVMEIKPLIDCDSANPYKIVRYDYDTRTSPILNSFNFTSIRTHDWGGSFTRPIARNGASYATGTGAAWVNDDDPTKQGAVPTIDKWAEQALVPLAVYASTWNDNNQNVCFLTDPTDPYIITSKMMEKLILSGNMYLFENGWRGIGCTHGYMISRKLFEGVNINNRVQTSKSWRGLSDLAKWQASDILDFFEDSRSHNADAAYDVSKIPSAMASNLASWWTYDAITDWTSSLPTANDFYAVNSSGINDLNLFSLNFALNLSDHADKDLRYSYLFCDSQRIYHHAADEELMTCFTDEIADGNGMKSLYAYTNKDDRKFSPLVWGALIKESEIVNQDCYDVMKWPRTKMKQDAVASTDLKDFYNGAFTYTDKTGSKKNVHFYGGFPLFVADKDYKKITITLTEKKGTSPGSSGRVWLKKGEFLNGSDLSASPWTAAERNNLYKINGTAGTSSTNYGYNISFNTATQLVLNDIAAGEEVFLRFSDSSNDTGCLIDSIQIEAEIEN